MEELFGGVERAVEHERGERGRRGGEGRQREASFTLDCRENNCTDACYSTTVLAALNATYLSTLQGD